VKLLDRRMRGSHGLSSLVFLQGEYPRTDGMINKQIADSLGVSEDTVRAHVARPGAVGYHGTNASKWANHETDRRSPCNSTCPTQRLSRPAAMWIDGGQTARHERFEA
jgi:hypothetical protein